MQKLINIYRQINLLNLDVVAGAVIGSLFLAKWYEVTPSVVSLISLALTVWLIYTADRLLDVKDAKEAVTSARHVFHQRYRQHLLSGLVFIIVADLALIWFMPQIIIKRGLVLSLVVIGYILYRKKLRLLKEFFVALLYAAGVAIPALPESTVPIRSHLPLLALFLIALINLILFSYYEIELDRNTGQHSIATILSNKAIRILLLLLFIASLSLSVYIMISLKLYVAPIVLITMTAILILIYVQKPFFEKKDYFRLAGDAIFILPLLYVLS